MTVTGRALAFAGRNLLRQPGRASVGILGIAAVGALLLDMLLLSRGLVVSFRDLLDSVGFDVRVLASDAPPMGGPRLPDAPIVIRQLAALPEVDEAMMVRFVDATVDETAAHKFVHFSMTAIDLGKRRPWTVKDGQDLDAAAGPAMLLNPRLAEALHAKPADIVSCRMCRRTRCTAACALPRQRHRRISVRRCHVAGWGGIERRSDGGVRW
jgi:hypothetical protein